MSSWLSLSNGTFAELASPNGSNNILNTVLASAFPAPGGDPQGQKQTPFCQRKNSHCVMAPDFDGMKPSAAPLREVYYEVFSLQNGILNQIAASRIQKTKIVVLETNSTNPNTTICSEQAIAKGGCQTPTPGCILTSNSLCDPLGFYTDTYSASYTGANTVTQQFIVDRGYVSVFWPQKASDGNVYWYGAYSQTAAVDATNIPQGAKIIQVNPDLQNGAFCPSGCSYTRADGTVLTP